MFCLCCYAHFLPSASQISAPKIFRRHGNPKLDFGIEGEEPRLSQPGHVRGARNVHNQNAATMAIALSEINRLGLCVIENLSDLVRH